MATLSPMAASPLPTASTKTKSPSSSSGGGGGGLSTGAIAGISVGGVLVLVLLGVGMHYSYKGWRLGKVLPNSSDEAENPNLSAVPTNKVTPLSHTATATSAATAAATLAADARTAASIPLAPMITPSEVVKTAPELTDVFLTHDWGKDEEGRDNHARVHKHAKCHLIMSCNNCMLCAILYITKCLHSFTCLFGFLNRIIARIRTILGA